MKKTILLAPISCCLFSTLSKAQAYLPLLKQGRSWDIAWIDGGTICGTTSAFRAAIDGDTTINGERYFKFYSHPIQTANGQQPFCSPFVVQPSRTLMPVFLREDTLQERVYLLQPGQPEGLLYDFSLSVGDTLHSVSGGFPGPQPQPLDIVITQTTPVTLANGVQSWRFDWQSGGTGAIIEGVGSNVNLFGPFMQGIGAGETLMCLSENGQKIYSGQFGNCTMPFLSTPEPVPTAIELSPNPVTGHLTLKGLPASAILTLTNATGRVIIKEKMNSSGQVSLSSFSPGIYQLSATWQGGHWSSRVVKE